MFRLRFLVYNPYEVLKKIPNHNLVLYLLTRISFIKDKNLKRLLKNLKFIHFYLEHYGEISQ